MANQPRHRIVLGRVIGPDIANSWRARLVPGATVFSAIARDVLSRRLTDGGPATDQGAADLYARRDDGPIVNRCSVVVSDPAGAMVGVGPLLRLDKWIAGQVDEAAAGNDFTDDSVDARDATAADVPVLINGAGGGFGAADGILFGATERFSLLRLTCSTADGGGGTIQIRYWSGAAWAALTALASTGTFGAAGTILGATGLREILFDLPSDATASTAGAPAEGIPAGYFLVRIDYTVAPGVAPVLSRVDMGDPLMLRAIGVGADTTADLVRGEDSPLLAGDAGDGVVVAWTAAEADNYAYVQGEDVGVVRTIGTVA